MEKVKPADLLVQQGCEALVVVPLPDSRGSSLTRVRLSSRTNILALFRRRLTPVARSRSFRVALGVALVFALFAGSAWVMFDIPDQPGNVALDTLMCIVTALFLVEFLVNILVDVRKYPFSFFFFADLLGAASMVFEISFLLGPAGKVARGKGSMSTFIMRTARAAKVGARLGRLSKLVKCLSMLSNKSSSLENKNAAEAKVLSQRLMQTLSTKVSLLTIMLVLVVPLFGIGSYPEEDLSMQAWAQRLEVDYRRACDELSVSGASNTSTVFSDAILEMVGFYRSMNYSPYRVDGFSLPVTISGRDIVVPGAELLQGRDPSRRQNIYVQEVADVLVDRPSGIKPVLYFDFKVPKQVEAGLDIAMIFFIIVVMVVAYFNLSYTLDAMVVKPLERMLSLVKTMAGSLLRQFGVDEEQEEGEEDSEGRELVEETAMLENIVRKFARLASLAAQPNVAMEEDLADMDEEGKGVLMEMMNMRVQPSKDRHTVALGRGTITGPFTISAMSLPQGGLPTLPNGISSSGLSGPSLPVGRDVVDSWDLDVLSLDAEGLRRVVLYIFFDSHMSEATGRAWTELDQFHRFHISVKSGYHDMPYHCYAHACDVLHSVFRLLTVSRSEQWLSDIERYALLIAALCHDIGHMGKTNPFLVETRHELALRYNDKSPLENMHCARLFEICSATETNIFEKAGADGAKHARKVCISAILKTDNASHFEMVKDISRAYEVASEVCEMQASQPSELTLPYLDQVMRKNTFLWLELFLHLADVSNPLKPFPICKLWAWRILDEFFAQGDEEKKLGLPVGMLNDRDKINRPGSQHGFINFLVAPLVVTSVKIFPSLHPLSTQMASNLETWRSVWVEEARPSPEDVAKRDVDVQKIKDTAAQLRHRT